MSLLTESLSPDTGYRDPGFESREVIDWSRWWKCHTRILFGGTVTGDFSPVLFAPKLQLFGERQVSVTSNEIVSLNNRVSVSVLYEVPAPRATNKYCFRLKWRRTQAFLPADLADLTAQKRKQGSHFPFASEMPTKTARNRLLRLFSDHHASRDFPAV